MFSDLLMFIHFFVYSSIVAYDGCRRQAQMSLPAVAALTDSDPEPVPTGSQVAAVTELSDSEAGSDASRNPTPAKRRRVRKSSKPLPRERLASEDNLELLVSRPCKRCRQQCLLKFQPISKFNELKNYRKHWSELHKTDQDQLASRNSLVFVIVQKH